MDHGYFMRLAIEEAKKSESDLKIGAVLVKEGKVISIGFREMIGTVGVHAEEKIVRSIVNSEGCVLYLTLEPCFYRNNDLEPCCDLILGSGVRKVFVGLKDINSKIYGKGIERLKSFGVEVILFSEGLEKELLELLGEEYINKHND